MCEREEFQLVRPEVEAKRVKGETHKPCPKSRWFCLLSGLTVCLKGFLCLKLCLNLIFLFHLFVHFVIIVDDAVETKPKGKINDVVVSVFQQERR